MTGSWEAPPRGSLAPRVAHPGSFATSPPPPVHRSGWPRAGVLFAVRAAKANWGFMSTAPTLALAGGVGWSMGVEGERVFVSACGGLQGIPGRRVLHVWPSFGLSIA